MRKVVDQVIALLGVEPDGVERDQLIFDRGQLQTVLWLWKDLRDRERFGWSVTTYNAALRMPMAEFGGLGVRIIHPQPSGEVPSQIVPGACYPWPTGADGFSAETTSSFTGYGTLSLGFVGDLHDLGELLLADDHVQRGPVWSFAPRNSRAGRLAKAFLLARHAADDELEHAAWTKLRAMSEEPGILPGHLFRHHVADWAKDYSKATGIDLGDLIKLKTKRLR